MGKQRVAGTQCLSVCSQTYSRVSRSGQPSGLLRAEVVPAWDMELSGFLKNIKKILFRYNSHDMNFIILKSTIQSF